MIYHIAEKNEWLACANKSEYLPGRYDNDKFIHCSDSHQIESVLNCMFKGKNNLVLLKIDPTKLTAQTIYESPQGANEKFPHIYGTINKNAIIKVFELKCNKNGKFKITKQQL